MELTKNDKRLQILQIREDLKQQAKSIGDDEIIVCEDLKELEQTVFDFVPVKLGYEKNIPTEYRGKIVYFKYIALDGDTLRKLDLSELSFDDVVWIGSLPSSLSAIIELKDYNLDKYIKTDTPIYNKGIDFKRMNAKVDLTQSALVKYLGTPVCVSNVDFCRTNLSNNRLKNFIFYNSYLSNTEISLEYPKSKGKTKKWENKKGFIPIAKCGECDLLSVRKDGDYAVLKNCICNGLNTFKNWPTIGWGFFNPISRVCGYESSFRNTDMRFGIKAVIKNFHNYVGSDDDTKLPNGRRKLYLSSLFYSRPPQGFSFDDNESITLKKTFNEYKDYFEGTVNMINAIRAELLVFCYLNGEKILSKVELRNKRAQLKAELKKLKEQLLADKKAKYAVRNKKR